MAPESSQTPTLWVLAAVQALPDRAGRELGVLGIDAAFETRERATDGVSTAGNTMYRPIRVECELATPRLGRPLSRRLAFVPPRCATKSVELVLVQNVWRPVTTILLYLETASCLKGCWLP